ncbi:MAG: hypothetical protein AAGN66_23740 [Acidobacteriota bacterium]
MIDPERYQRVKDVVDLALKVERKAWPSWLAERCGDDVEVFLEVTTLLAASQHVDPTFIEGTALELLPAQALGGRIKP